MIEPDHCERHNHRNERQPISIETAREREQSETDAGKHRPDNARELKLRRIERDGVRQIFAPDQIERHRLVRWTSERHTTSSHKREHKNHPDVAAPDIASFVDHAGAYEHCKPKRGRTRHDLRVQEQAPAIDKICEYSSGKRKHHSRRQRHESIESQPEGRVSELQHQPPLRHRLHPRADV